MLILDEVQTGMGRTGEWFAYQHYGFEPDILTCAKALAAGVAAGVMIAKPNVAAALKPGMHASTFGGNPIACRAGLAAIETIEADGLLERGKAVGERFRDALRGVEGRDAGPDPRHPDQGRDDRPGPVDRRHGRRGRLHGAGAPDQRHARHVIRLLPALNITDEQIDEGCAHPGSTSLRRRAVA